MFVCLWERTKYIELQREIVKMLLQIIYSVFPIENAAEIFSFNILLKQIKI